MFPRPGRQSVAQSPGDPAWIETPFPATVTGRSSEGARFRYDTALDGLSSSELALRLPFPVDLCRALLVLIWVGPPAAPRSLGVIVRGAVTHAQERPGGAWRISVLFTRHRYLYRGGSFHLPR